MNGSNVQSSRGVTLVGGGAPDETIVRDLLSNAPFLVAADGGANGCVSFGLSPSAVVGDFDSVTPETRKNLPETRFLHVSEQDTTDFEKCLTAIEAPYILATGFTAGRLDHTLAVFSALAQYQRIPVIVVGERDVIFAAPSELELNVAPGTRVSLFPLQEVRGTSKGLKWPLDGLSLSPMGQIGTSNEATGTVSLTFDRRGCLVILPRDSLMTALYALIGPSSVLEE